MIVLTGLTNVERACRIRDILQTKFDVRFEVEQIQPLIPEWRIVTDETTIPALNIYIIFAEGVATGLGATHK